MWVKSMSGTTKYSYYYLRLQRTDKMSENFPAKVLFLRSCFFQHWWTAARFNWCNLHTKVSTV